MQGDIRHPRDSAVPTGLMQFPTGPGVETPGYYQRSHPGPPDEPDNNYRKALGALTWRVNKPSNSQPVRPKKRWLLAASLLVAMTATAAPPVCDYIFPAGGQVGTTFDVTVGGKL